MLVERIARYLNDALATRDLGKSFTKAIGDIARAHGVSQLAREIGMDRQRIYRSFDGTGTPQIDTVFKVLAALKVELVTKAKA
jgi:probable addiction module antidote protein